MTTLFGKDCYVIQAHYWNNEPYNERWLEEDLYIVCPITGKNNRVYFDINFNREYDPNRDFNYKYRHLFKKVINKHIEQNIFSKFKFKNNDYFDKNKERFGLTNDK